MSDFLPDSPMMVRLYCPTCEPYADDGTALLDTLYCDAHRPSTEGAMDRIVDSSNYLAGSMEAGGEDNRKWCEIFHRGRIDGGRD